MDSAPAGLLCQRARLDDINPLIGHHMDVQPVALVHLKDPDALQLGPGSLHGSQEAVPALAGVLDAQELLEREGPHEQSVLRELAR